MSNDFDAPANESDSGFPKWLKWSLLGALGLLIVGYGAIFLYAKVINDSPDELGTNDLDAALDGDAASADVTDPAGIAGSTDAPAPATTEGSDTTQPTDEPSATTQPAATDATTAAGGDSWAVTQASELGYRVKEVLFGVDTEAVGRTNQITGSLAIDGTTVTAAEFVVDVASIKSDESRRDGQFAGRIMSTDQFPTATFTLTEPIELGVEATEGAAVTAEAAGDLTLRGVTNPVSFEVTAKLENGKIGVLGSIPVVFADYEIANPSFGGITTEDNGLLEFVLVFEAA